MTLTTDTVSAGRMWWRRPLALAAALLLALAGITVASVPYTARGSSMHANAFTSLARDCAEDEGEAIAGGTSRAQPGAQDRCLTVGLERLGTAFVLVLPVAVLGGLELRRRSARRSYATTWHG